MEAHYIGNNRGFLALAQDGLFDQDAVFPDETVIPETGGAESSSSLAKRLPPLADVDLLDVGQDRIGIKESTIERHSEQKTSTRSSTVASGGLYCSEWARWTED